MNIKDILNALTVTSKKTEKLAILNEHKDNELLKQVFKYALDPMITFGIKKIPSYLNAEESYNLEDSFITLELLISRELTGNAAIDALSKELSEQSSLNAPILEMIIKKDLRCGVSYKTVNKVWGNDFIKEFPVMLASSFNEKNLARIDFERGILAQTKMDGGRLEVIVDGGDITCYTRNGRVIDITSQFSDLPFGRYVIDGELLAYEDNIILDRKTGNGIMNSCIAFTASDKDKLKMKMVAWDIVPLDDFWKGKYNKGAEERLDDLKGMVEECVNVSTIDNIIIYTHEQAQELYKIKVAEGEEGIILKNRDSIWENRRSRDCVKMKEVLDIDLKITGLNEGSGRHKGRLGSISVTDASDTLRVDVGTGLSDAQRTLFWDRRDELIGSIIEVQYNAIINSKGKKAPSLFLPVFVELRKDKSLPNNIGYNSDK
jgi:ATP-dependent DNA ligase